MKLPLRYNLRSVLQRKTRSALTAGGVAVAIFISVMMIALSRGVIHSTLGNASPDNVIALSKGAESMEFSAIDPSDFHLLRTAEQIAVNADETLASPEAYLSTFVRFPDNQVPGEKRGVIRGVWPMALKVHENVRVLAGAMPQRGFQVAVGKLAATKLGVPSDALSVGRSIEFEGQRWTIAGIFEAPGATLESEIWGHLDDVLVASKRTDYSAIVLKTKSPESAEELLLDLAARTDVRLDSKTESEYYAALANALKPVQVVSITMTVLLVMGAVMAGMNTMFTSILGRTREMGVLLVLGYKRKAVLISFILESVLLSLCGGVLGTATGALLNGLPMKMPMGAFRFIIDGQTLGVGIVLAALIGVLGALVPVLRVARLQTVEALRAD